MTDIEYSNSLFELNEILKILDNNLVKKIPESLINLINNDKSTSYDFHLDYSKPLSEQKLSETTQLLLTSILLKYWCNEEEKQQILIAMRENENKHQEELKEKYNPNDLFKNKSNTFVNNNTQEQCVEQQMQMIEYKQESWIKKLFSKIKNFFKK